MKLTIIAKENGGHQNELIEAAQKQGLEASIVGLDYLDIPTKNVKKKLGDAVIWRRANGIDIRAERPAMDNFFDNKVMVSDTVFKYPMVYQKYYQQQIIKQEPATSKWSIPTYLFKSVKDFELALKDSLIKLPVIAKPNAGSRGDGIVLIENISDLNSLKPMKNYVFQNFIKNNGDWRVIVIGGSPIGVLLRKGKEGQIVNNISKGAIGSCELDSETLYNVRKISTKVASLFHSVFCGVDIIRDAETGEYFVLELNTAPQWRGESGLESVTGIKVADKVIDWIVERDPKSKKSVSESVEYYYKNRINQIPSEEFHFNSRLWLWTGDDWARKNLDNLKAAFIGDNPEEISARIKQIINNKSSKSLSVNQKKSYRENSFKKYKKLPLYNALLFKTVFCDSVYDLDLRPYIREQISDKDFINLFYDLINDKDAVRLLSTHAINYFYLLKNYFKGKLSLSSLVLVSTDEILRLLPGYKKLEGKGVISKKDSVKLQIYLLTHAIIGESRFYSRPVRMNRYVILCKKIERIIAENYFDVTLDNKFEFLVCSKICGYEPEIKSLIEQESVKSISWAGNFMVDTLNSNRSSLTSHCLRSSEHRNVLYLMSQKDYSRAKLRIPRNKVKLPPIGRLAMVKLSDFGVRRVIARVDSGATKSSIDASNIYEQDGMLHFTLFNKNSPLYTGKEFTTKEFININVKSTIGEQDRYSTMLKFEINNQSYEVLFALSDRAHMLYPVLLGRNFLRGKYTIDTSKQFIEKLNKNKKQ